MAALRTILPALFTALLALPVAADAITLRADFTGTVTAEQILQFPPHPASYYDGATVTGYLQTDIADPQLQGGDASGASYYNGGSQQLVYTFLGQTYSFASSAADPGVILLFDTPAGQFVDFRSNFIPKYNGGIFTISGPAGSLFDGLDPLSLRVTPGAGYSFTTGFASADAAMRFNVALADVNLRVVTPVPEPSIALLLLGGGMALAWQRRRKPAPNML